MNVEALVTGLFRSPPKKQRRAEIAEMADYVDRNLSDPRWVKTSKFIADNPGVLTWREEQDIHYRLWQQIRQHVRSHTRVA